MTVAELIEELRKLPQDWTVYVRGYEYGVEDVTRVNPSHFDRDIRDNPWAGPHEDVNKGIGRDRHLEVNGVEIQGGEWLAGPLGGVGRRKPGGEQ